MLLWIGLLVAAVEPPPLLLAAQRADEPQQALAAVESAVAESPARAADLGLHYLHGDLLEASGRRREAAEAFALALARTPALAPWARLRLARLLADDDHPEVAAGLLATLLAREAPAALLPEAARLFADSLVAGGDCALLAPVRWRELPAGERRRVGLAAAECLRRRGEAGARAILVSLLAENGEDEVGRLAALRLLPALAPAAEPRLALRTTAALVQHEEAEAARGLVMAVLAAPDLPQPVRQEALYLLGRVEFAREDFVAASARFGELAAASAPGQGRSRALYQRGRCLELLGQPRAAVVAYVRAANSQPASDWTPPALLAALRLQWLAGDLAAVDEALAALRSRRAWGPYLSRATLFLASSDLVGGRTDRAAGWLAEAAQGGGASAGELGYWTGRLDEARGRPAAALAAYLRLARLDPYHPFVAAARQRAAGAALAPAVAAAATAGLEERLALWLLLPAGEPLRERLTPWLYQRLARDPELAPVLRLAPAEPADWPLWRQELVSGEDLLLALGRWQEAPLAAVLSHFSLREPSLAFAASRQLAAAGARRHSIYLAEQLRRRLGSGVPEPLLPVPLRHLLYPLPAGGAFVAAPPGPGDAALLAAIVREEGGLPGLTGDGLRLLPPSRARELAAAQGHSDLRRATLADPELAVGLLAAHLAQLAARLGATAAGHELLAAHHAGAPQAVLWRSWCASDEPEEYLTKVAFRETRAYLERVLATRRRYLELYPVIAAPPGDSLHLADGE